VSWLQDPAKTAENYATEDNLRARQALYDEVEGEAAPDVLRRVIAELRPRRVLEVGGGQGELAEWMLAELGAEVEYVDLSPRMAELARARGISARQGDVQELPFADGSFDTVVAAWMLFHVPDLDRGLAEIERVLAPGGFLVAVTNSVDNLRELRELMEYDRPPQSFHRENGEELLGRQFARIERHDVDNRVIVRRREQLVAYRQSLPAETEPIPEDVELPFMTYSRVTIFVASGAQ
jgi:ubiquinone/menaquinone biosynthesis C-methylase UbiE